MHTVLLLCLVSADWWTNYGDPELNRLVERAMSNNLDLQAAMHRIAEARALTGTAKSKLGPNINATASAQRLRGGFSQGVTRVGQTDGGTFVSPFETGLFQGGLDMKWELDFFGTNRAGLKAAQSDLAAEQQRREDLAITVSAETARYYIQLRGIEDRIAITKQNIATQRDLLGLTEDRVKAGLDSQLDIERQRVLIANTEASLAPLEADVALARNRLMVLTGDETYTPAVTAEAKTDLKLPAIGGDLSSELLKRRPDVKAAEARLEAALARLKQARSDLYPKINLNGLLGRQGTSVGGLSLGGGNFFNLGPQLQLPIFNTGRIRSNIAANNERLEQERIAYRSEILTAFEEAANAIASMRRQAERADRLATSREAAHKSFELASDLQRAGLNDFLTVLDAQRSLLDSDFQLSVARTQALVESVALYKALAGGWIN